MLDPLSRTEITYSEQFSDSQRVTELPPGFLAYHQQNFCHYFHLSPEEFQGKTVLETGAGPGKHAAALHSLGAYVTAVDLLESNIKAIERLKTANGLQNLVVLRADLMQPLPRELGRFDLISAHNWLQHAEHPGVVLENLDEKLKIGGRFYLSVYQGGTFRFFINQIARSVLRWSDRVVVRELIPFFFPTGFLEFENPVIFLENVLDDFFVPYMGRFTYASLVKFLEGLGYEVLVPHRGRSPLYAIDDEPLRVGMIKRSDKKSELEGLEFHVDEFKVSHVQNDCHRGILEESVEWAQRSIDILKHTEEQNAYLRAGFCLGLYRLRARYSRSHGVEERHAALREYLKRFVTGDISSIRAWEESGRYHGYNVR